MDECSFDDLVRKFSAHAGSRRRALELTGAALLTGVVPPLFPRDVEAMSRRKCHKKNGRYLSSGQCHCTYSCETHHNVDFHCHGNRHCYCYQTVAGDAFCMGASAPSSCTADDQCATGFRCIVTLDCSRADVSCTGPADCGGGLCLNSRCMTTFCATPCPT